LHQQGIATSPGLQERGPVACGSPEGLAQIRDLDLKGIGRIEGKLVPPKEVDEGVRAHRVTSAQQLGGGLCTRRCARLLCSSLCGTRAGSVASRGVGWSARAVVLMGARRGADVVVSGSPERHHLDLGVSRRSIDQSR
jgi:hypothetical protein